MQPDETHEGTSYDILLAMRKHHSLDGSQFPTQQNRLNNSYTTAACNFALLEPTFRSPNLINRQPQPYDQKQQLGLNTLAQTNQNYQQSYRRENFDSQAQMLLIRAPDPNLVSDPCQQQQLFPTINSYSSINPSINTGGFMATKPSLLYAPSDDAFNTMIVDENEDNDNLSKKNLVDYQPISAQAILQNIDFDIHSLRQEFIVLCDCFNNLAASVRTFWAPQLKQERKRHKEYTFTIIQFEHQFAQLNSEIQMLRMELERRQGQQIEEHSRPSDFTDHSITLHEWQTLKTKLERSELNLSERTRELQNMELQAKCSEEQKEEVERRNDILTRTNSANETQLKLLQEDLNVLRGKLELKNQQLETREKANKKMDAQLESLRLELKDSQQTVQDGERRIAMLTHRLDQMERESREKEVQVESLRQCILQQPNTRTEIELQQKLDNAQEDRIKLEQMIDQLRQQNETERQEQLQQFFVEREKLEASIAYLNKELADRHVLIGSQSEKISQLDSAMKSANQHHYQQQYEILSVTVGTNDEQTKKITHEDGEFLQDGKILTMNIKEEQQQQIDLAASELERTHREVDRLLKRVQQMERERAELMNSRREDEIGNGRTFNNLAIGTKEIGIDGMTTDEQRRQRIRDLEEALRESVECTAEKEKALTIQKQLVEKLSLQINEMFEATGTASTITSYKHQLHDAKAQLEDTQRHLEEERQQRKRQVSIVRKELGLALVAEKEAAIALIQNYCPNIDAVPGLREKLDTFSRLKEALKHSLLMSSANEEQVRQQNFGISELLQTNIGHHSSMAPIQSGRPLSATFPTSPHHSLEQQSLLTSSIAATSLAQPIRIHTTNLYSAFIPQQHSQQNSGGEFCAEDVNCSVDEEGIWA